MQRREDVERQGVSGRERERAALEYRILSGPCENPGDHTAKDTFGRTQRTANVYKRRTLVERCDKAHAERRLFVCKTRCCLLL